jgi:signal peptidase I
MKKVFLMVIGSLAALSSCRDQPDKQDSGQVTTGAAPIPGKSVIENKQLSNQDYLAELQDICVEDSGVFKNCDALFGKDGSYYSFLIIPKFGARHWYEETSKDLEGQTYEKNNTLSARIQRIDKEKLSADFDVWVFYIDKKYTKHVGMDAAYNIINPHVTELYYLRSGKNNWEELDSFKVNNNSEDQKENQWKDDFTDKAIQRSNKMADQSATVVEPIPAAWNGKYSVYLSYGDIAGQNAGWALEIIIKGDKITASGDGYQMAFLDELSARTHGSELILTHIKNVSGYPRGNKMNPEFTLIKNEGKFYVKSDWIDHDVMTQPAAFGYKIDKTDF